MSWNYRLMHRKLKDGQEFYWVGEAYYDDTTGEFDGGYSESYEHLLSAETPADLRATLKLINEAMDKDILEIPAKEQL